MDEWRDTFLTEARLRNVPGTQIGEALAEIDTHCRDSGERPDVAFGDPVRYAETLVRDGPSARFGGANRLWTSTAMAAANLMGIASLLAGVESVTQDTRGGLTVGQLVSTALGTVGIVLIVALILRPGQGRQNLRWRLGVAVAVGIGLTMFPQFVWKQIAFHAPGWALLTFGLLLFALAWWPLAQDRLLADRVVDPRTGREPFKPPPLLLFAVRWSLPAVLLIVVLLAVWFPTE